MDFLQKRSAQFLLVGLIIAALVFIFLSFSEDTKPSSTVTTSKSESNPVKTVSVSVEEAVYADLAIRHYLNNVSVYSLDQDPKNTVSINADKQWLPASTVKTFVAMYAYDQIYKGNLNFDDQILIDAKNVVPTELVTEEMPALVEGQYVSIDRLIRQMVTQSDNTAYNVLLEVLDRTSISDYVRGLGLTHTSIGSKLNLDDSQQQYEISAPGYGINTRTAGDYLEAFKLINEGKISGSESLLSIFSQQKINNMIPFFLPKGVTVAHKTGDLDPLYHDGGIIITPNRKYILTIFTNTGDPKIVAHISDLIYSKDLNLVGQEEKANATISQASPDQSLDPLVANGTVNSQVLGASTAPVPAISAADLGIKASDLTSANPGTLPKVFIPANSRVHFIVSSFQAIRRLVSITPAMKRGTNVAEMSLKVAEANDLRAKGRVDAANSLLKSTQAQMVTVAKTKGVLNDTSTQTAIETLSDARFSILSDELKSKAKDDKTVLIKEIATQAKETAKEVQPLIPQAGSAVSPAQNPIVGEVISSNSTSIKIRTAGGQELQIPNQEVKMKESVASATTSATTTASSSAAIKVSSLSTLKTGSTVALVGASNGTTFVPSFVLKNISKEIAAPKPVTILKVDPKKNILVVSENGVAVQVNLTKNAVIKGKDTNISLSSIKAGDVVVVHPEEKPVPTAVVAPSSPSVSPTSVPSASLKPTESVPGVKSSPSSATTASVSPTPTSSGVSASSVPGVKSSPSTSAKSNTQQVATGAPAAKNASGTTAPSASKPSAPTPAKPTVIQSSSVQVIEKKQDVGKPAVSQPSAPKKEAPAPAAAPANKPAAPVTSSKPTQSNNQQQQR